MRPIVVMLRAARRFARWSVFLYILVLGAGVALFKISAFSSVARDPLFATYSSIVSVYILSRFVLAAFYRPAPDRGYEPTVAVVMTAFNEEDVIERSVRALLRVDYPHNKLEVVVIDDGSTDGTLRALKRLAQSETRLLVVHFLENKGKRAAMAAGIRRTVAEFIVFVDSDSILRRDSIRAIVQDFTDSRVGAVSGHAFVDNMKVSWLTKMQGVRYYVAFSVIKAAESLFGAVTCCSGCFAAYRRSAILPHLTRWENQKFLRAPATFGDDRSLTNFILRDLRVTYQSRAICHTVVPHTLGRFMRQQARWKRSWTRESLRCARFAWRKNPVASAAVYMSTILPLLAPIVAARTLLWLPLFGHRGFPFLYLLGMYTMALIYSLYYLFRIDDRDGTWMFGIVFVFFYLAVLIWQNYYAIATARRSSWGTRSARAPSRPTVPSRGERSHRIVDGEVAT